MKKPEIDLIFIAKAQGFDGTGPADTYEELGQALSVSQAVARSNGRHIIDARIEPRARRAVSY